MTSASHRSSFPSAAIAAIVAIASVACDRPAADDTPEDTPEPDPAAADHSMLLTPAALTETAPDVFQARFETSRGDFVIEVHREWSPNGADRFYNLVANGYFDDVRFFRVVAGFMAQFGMHGDPAVTAAWRTQPIEDDPVMQSNTRGFVSFAMTNQPNSRTTQVFVNFGDNSGLDEMGFSPFGQVIEGMDVVDQLHSGYGDAPPGGRGPNQGAIQTRGNDYLMADFPNLDYVRRATIVR